jgi:hypothetical protein
MLFTQLNMGINYLRYLPLALLICGIFLMLIGVYFAIKLLLILVNTFSQKNNSFILSLNVYILDTYAQDS